jgi:formylglycine-generating enzyme required for sulfatase activity
VLINPPVAYRDYLYEFPEGTCREQAEQALERLEREMLEDLQKNPSETDLTTFCMQFPGCNNLEALLDIVLKNKPLQKNFRPLIEQRWAECRLLHPDFPAIPIPEDLPPALPDAPLPDTPAAPPATPIPNQPNTPIRPEASAPNVPVPAMILLRSGTFVMGSETGLEDEKPRRNVTVRDFYMGKTEVTFDEYDRFCDATGHPHPKDAGWGRGSRPVIYVSWFDAVAYCNWLSAAHNLATAYTTMPDGRIAFNRNANGYRLPTEAEWEYAARSGKNYTYSGSDNLNEIAWYMENSSSSTHPVAQKAPNTSGLHDMSGNVREWCHDWHGTYPATDAVNPLGPPSAKTRVLRGGQWDRNPEQLRITYRNAAKPTFSDYNTGFRLARWP